MELVLDGGWLGEQLFTRQEKECGHSSGAAALLQLSPCIIDKLLNTGGVLAFVHYLSVDTWAGGALSTSSWHQSAWEWLHCAVVPTRAPQWINTTQWIAQILLTVDRTNTTPARRGHPGKCLSPHPFHFDPLESWNP